MFAFETLCRCGHLTSDHVTVGSWTPGQLPEFGETPCVRCNEEIAVNSALVGVNEPMLDRCIGFSEWPINEIPAPGTAAAIVLNCICPIEANVAARTRRTPPVYADDCPLHIWICKRTDICDHSTAETENTIDHRKPHYACEHCTVPNIECSTCGKVWVDWRVGPETAGWRRALPGGTLHCGPNAPKINYWRCGTCSSTNATN